MMMVVQSYKSDKNGWILLTVGWTSSLFSLYLKMPYLRYNLVLDFGSKFMQAHLDTKPRTMQVNDQKLELKSRRVSVCEIKRHQGNTILDDRCGTKWHQVARLPEHSGTEFQID